jgi:hypothetical protein
VVQCGTLVKCACAWIFDIGVRKGEPVSRSALICSMHCKRVLLALADSQSVSHSDQFGQGLRLHLTHDLSAMDTDGDFACAEFSRDLFA